MKPNTLRALVGKYICKQSHVRYCHVDYIISIEEQLGRAIVTAVSIFRNGKVQHAFIEVLWSTDANGVFEITKCNVLKEDELDGYDPQRDKFIPEHSKRL